MRDPLDSRRCSRYLRALADPERLRIVQSLRAGPLAAGVIADQLGLPAANVSHHLKQLRTAGLVASRRDGRHIIYTLAPRLLEHTPAPATRGRARRPLDVLDFGCCRLELGE